MIDEAARSAVLAAVEHAKRLAKPSVPFTRADFLALVRESKAMALRGKNLTAPKGANKLLRDMGEDRFTEQEDEEIKLLAAMDAVDTELYRYYDDAGKLLYVGISLSTVARAVQHRQNADWYESAVHIKIQRFKSRSAAAWAEQQAIKSERPLHNIIHNDVERPKRIPDEIEQLRCQLSETRDKSGFVSS